MTDNRTTEYIYKHISKSGEDSHGSLVSLPTMVRREEIVRCRDCKLAITRWHEFYGKDATFCGRFVQMTETAIAAKVEPDGFCAWGERRCDR